MIRVTIELVPHGDETRRKIIGTGLIINDDTGTMEEGNYTYTLYKNEELCKAGSLENFPRIVYDVWELLRQVLNQEEE
ncbi:MAG: hypothetical protein ACW99U_20650, partial [Candidatus Thorarchaeota archaeon]|jgi:hypothetical protein